MVVVWFGVIDFVVVRSVRTNEMKQTFCTFYSCNIIVAYVVDLSIT